MEDVQPVIKNDKDAACSKLQRMINGDTETTPLIDIGTTSLTGLRSNGFNGLPGGKKLGHPIFDTLALTPDICRRLGSDFIRTGVIFDQPEIINGKHIDRFGVHWQWEGSCFSPIEHPLENAEFSDVAHHSMPQWREPVQHIKPEESNADIIIADSPCPGLLDLCFLLRGKWQLIEDLISDRRTFSALLEWSVEAIVEAYTYMLTQLPVQPDVIVYSDDLGYENSMFFSPTEFRTFFFPVLRTLIMRLRSLTSAAICFHSCGAILPILSDISKLGIEIVNLDINANGMDVNSIRKNLGHSIVLHGFNDLCALGAAVENRDKAKIAFLITEMAESAPVIAGPVDSLSSINELRNALWGAAYIRNLSSDDFAQLKKIGPVRSIIEDALHKTHLSGLPVDLDKFSSGAEIIR